MEVIAAINLYNGLCINTIEPDYNTIHDCDPINFAKRWNNIGANWIHLADINGIKENNPVNLDIIKNIISKVNAPIQVAAGINNLDDFEDILAAGARRIVLDEKVLFDSDFIEKALIEYPEKTIIAFNADSGSVKIDENYHENIADLINNLKKKGLRRIIYHDISENFEFNYDDLVALGTSTGLPLIACGKLNDMESIKKLKYLSECEGTNIEGLILSKPLYNDTLNLYDVIKQIDAYPYIGDFYSREDIC